MADTKQKFRNAAYGAERPKTTRHEETQAEYKKTSTLRALRLAKEAAEQTGKADQKPASHKKKSSA